MAKISVIIPVYNAAAYLPRCLDSILKQTFNDVEVLCVNDCSADDSLQVLEQYARQDNRIKIFINKENIGAALSRNVGLDNAKGEYIYFMDSDDWVDNNYLEVMLSTIEKADTDIIMNMSMMQEYATESVPYVQPDMLSVAGDGQYVDKYVMIAKTPCVLWARFYKRAFLEDHHLRFNVTKNTGEDLIFHYISHIWSEKSFVFNGPVYHYRIRQDSMTGQAKNAKYWDVHFIATYDAVYDYYKEHGFLDNLPIPIFHLMSFFTIDNAEKFAIYQAYLKKVRSYLEAHPDIYNEAERYVAKIVCEAENFDDFKAHHALNLTVDFLRHRK